MNMRMPINIAVIGRRKAGKSTLLQALNTYADERGIAECVDCYGIEPSSFFVDNLTIDYTRLELDCGRTCYFYEFSHFTDFYKCMITNTLRIDAVLYVCFGDSATLNINLQALDFIKRMGIDRILGCINYFDLDASDVLMRLAASDYKATLTEYGYAADDLALLNLYDAANGVSDALDAVRGLLDLINTIPRHEPADADAHIAFKFEADAYVLTSEESGFYKSLSENARIRFTGEPDFMDCSLSFEDGRFSGEITTVQCALSLPHAVKLGSTFSILTEGVLVAFAKVIKLG